MNNKTTIFAQKKKMPILRKAIDTDLEKLALIARKTFMEAHSASAPSAILNAYLDEKYTIEALAADIADPANYYAVLEDKGELIGFSKVTYNSICPSLAGKNNTKLDRLYVLQTHYGLGLGYQLLQFNIALAKENDQAGLWLFTWTENHKAITFYEKTGFEIVGSYLFKLNEERSNPNHVMYLAF